MKIALAILLISTVVVGSALLVVLRKPIDRPTVEIAKAMAVIALPEDLPELPLGPNTSGREPREIYDQLIELYRSTPGQWRLGRVTVDTEQMRRAETLMIELSECGPFAAGFLDQQTPMVFSGSHPDALALISLISAMTVDRFAELREEERWNDAERLGLALTTVGRQLLASNTLIPNRILGLRTLAGGIDQLNLMASELNLTDPASVRAWQLAVNDTIKRLETKVGQLNRTQPHVGDVIHVARYDEDPAFRAHAVMTMAWVQYRPGTKGNLQAMRRAIKNGLQSETPSIREAAEYARDFTVEDVRRNVG